MSHLICKTLHHVRSANSASSCNTKGHNLYTTFLHIHSFSSSSLTSIESSPEQSSFTVTYLVNSCGFPLGKALSASKYVNFKSGDKPDSVIAFLENQGFTKTQISKLIRKNPAVLKTDPQNTLLPKLEFYKSKGVSNTEVAKICSLSPFLLMRSLENNIIPALNFFTEIIQSEEKALYALKQSAKFLSFDHQTYFASNVKALREAGVPNANILHLMITHTRMFMTDPRNFEQTVEEVVEMGFDPKKFNFGIAVKVLRSVSRTVWKKKVEVYKKWGWSEDEILVAFGKDPWCMSASEGKIMAAMDFFVNKMGLESSFLVERPKYISLSLGKRIVPRFAVYQALLSKGVIKKSRSTRLTTMIDYT